MSPRIDLRHAVSGLIDTGETPTTIVRTLHCPRFFVYKVKKWRDCGGDLSQKAYFREVPVMKPQV